MNLKKETSKAARKMMVDLYQMVLKDLSYGKVNPAGSDVLKAFEITHAMLVDVSSDAMQLTQLSIFQQNESEL